MLPSQNMETKKESLLDRFIWLVFLALTIFTPLLFTNINTELYEVPKMSIIYFGASLLLTLTAIKFVIDKKITLPKTPILLLLLAFIGANIASTIISLDKFTSIFGYPTRLNGGLISQLAFFIVFASALINLTSQKALRLLIVTVVTAFVVAQIGIASHFNLDASCLVLTGDLSSNCWQAEFNPRLRIFSTMGQPNWLATYLILTIPLSLALLFSTSQIRSRLVLSTIAFSLILALILTNSRSGFAGLIAALIIFFVLNSKTLIQKNRRLFFASIVIFVFLILTFGSTLLLRINESIKRQKTVEGGTETGQIRLIVWQGAIEAFKKAPLLGNGPETFAYSYSMNRPSVHNQTTEWNFFYNKAHNEFLNYLVNIGLVGTLTYLAFLTASLIRLLKIGQSQDSLTSSISKAGFSSIIGYHVAIFFGFSTVASQLVMFLTLAQILILNKINYYQVSLKLNHVFQKIALLVAFSTGLWLTIFVIRIYFADIFFNRTNNLSGEQAIKTSFNAIEAFPLQNPFYLSDFAQSYASRATEFEDEEAGEVFSLAAENFAQRAYLKAPNNFIILRRLINCYILLNSRNPKYENILLEFKQKLISLAPTDPQTYLTAAKIEVSLSNNQKAQEHLEYALELKPDYVESQQLLNEVKLTIDKEQSTINN